MPVVLRLSAVVVVCLCALAGARDAAAQYFGRNKVEYLDFDFRVFETTHFDVYHYPGEEAAARLAARLAERWYARLSRVLEHELQDRQPLILYGSHPEFAQTNVVSSFLNEGIGGVTDGLRRRIVMPFAATLSETDRVLGHEIVHAFQFDMIRKYGGRVTWPGWFIEGMAQYLSLGSTDEETAMWLRDAVIHELLPDKQQDAARRFSPYRYGHAFWAYVGGRFGDSVAADVLKKKGSAKLSRRFEAVTERDLDALFEEFRDAAREYYEPAAAHHDDPAARTLLTGERTGRLQLGPAVSPDGKRVAFFSERDRLSLDLYLADTATGEVLRKLATTTASARFDSLQAIRSAGAWSWDGSRFAFAAVNQGRPTLVVIDLARDEDQELVIPRVGQILSPSWSPGGNLLVFSMLAGGVTDLFTYDLKTRELHQLTDDLYADLQPAWSPDGRRIVFATDRFTSDPGSLTFGPTGLAVLDLETREIEAVEAFPNVRHLNPQWSPDGSSLLFIASPDGVANVFRLERRTGALFKVTRERGGVAGLAATSPALSVAHTAPVAVYTALRGGRYTLEMLEGAGALAGTRADREPVRLRPLPPGEREGSILAQVLSDGSPAGTAADLQARAYEPDLSLEAVGQPYLASGGGPFGTFVRAGGSMLFGDLLGERKLAASVQIGSRLRDLAIGVRYLNRERRWNWGAVAEIEPSLSRLPRQQLIEVDGEQALSSETHYYTRMQARVAGLLAYPLNRSQRFEFTAGVRHARYREDIRSLVRAIPTGRVLSESEIERSGGDPATVADISAAFVGDTSVYGPTGPILGRRYRFEVSPTIGGLSLTRVLADYRQYLMPVRPFTIAARLMHLGQYGADADDPRLLPTFVGSRYFVRGYGWGSIKCHWDETGTCTGFEELLGTRVAVANLELRAPLVGLLSGELRYGPIPTEIFAFADAGMTWYRPRSVAGEGGRRLVRSVGAGVRLNAAGLPFEVSAIRALDAPARGWSFDISFRPGF